ncbi:hypothetical protein OPKNFCMD_1386 [Methylobacterium crusticola]|uniref:Glycoside hydrolase family 5 domain-containing protein n=1 Tax=Methylobacterium crusticola TaxID=1697972 RepID=A0ABQ4QTN0_9HYPH|nr:cellulase family glycosylhydrolase [Methylobacterium crusticola]GJD48663.1 hypothetical protein OPKNFCMD_1386 [Methylobacterium crusticola]
MDASVTTPAAGQVAGRSGLKLLGVNLAGASFGELGGTDAIGTTHTYPTHATIDYFAAAGLNVFRLDLKWERIQPALGGALSETEMRYVDDIVAYAGSKGIAVDVSLHNFGKYGSDLIGSAQVPDAAFADVWGKLARRYAGSPNVLFGLMNEPYLQSATTWLPAANAAIAAIRSTGARQEILVPGTYWDGAQSWVSSDNDTVIGTGVVDPANNYAFEVHQYLDIASEGTHFNVVSATIGVERLQAITEWAKQTGSRLFLGEFAVATDATSLTALDKMLAYMSEHNDVWQGGTYWAAGEWWGDYPFAIQPIDGQDRPQLQVLDKYISASTTPFWVVPEPATAVQAPQPPANPLAPARRSFDGDDHSDILFRDDRGHVNAWLLSDGHVAAAPNIGTIGPQWSVAGTGDFNRDGTSDILWRDDAGHINAWLLHGGQVAAAPNVGTVGSEWSIEGTGDFNGDGRDDILWRDTAGHINAWHMNGDQVIAAPNIGTVGSNWSIVGTGDFNGDGTADLLWRDSAGHINQWLLHGGQVTSAPNIGTVGSDWTVAGIGDFNGDGKDDILWRDNVGHINTWLLDGAQIVSAPNIGRVGSDWSVAGTGDYDGDRRDDILFRDNAGHVNTWLLDGNHVTAAPNIGSVGPEWIIQA